MQVKFLSNQFSRRSFLAGMGAAVALPILAACEAQVVEVEKVQVVEKEVPVERVVTQVIEKEVERVVTVEVDRPVEVEKVVTVEVEKAVEVEVEKVVTVQVEVERAVEVEKVSQPLCGAHRPGHFRGVTTVVAKLFNMVKPHAALFGEKDFQQCVVIKRMVRDLNFDLDIVAMPTVRESDGLAMSSRNARLSPAQRQTSLCIAGALNTAHQLVGQGERRAATILQAVRDTISGQDDTRLEYASLCDPETLEEVEEVARPTLLAIAAWVGKVRLIDNRVIG